MTKRIRQKIIYVHPWLDFLLQSTQASQGSPFPRHCGESRNLTFIRGDSGFRQNDDYLCALALKKIHHRVHKDHRVKHRVKKLCDLCASLCDLCVKKITFWIASLRSQ